MTLSEDDKAFCAICWHNGMTQKEISRLFGYKSPANAALAIRDFLMQYHPAGLRDRCTTGGLKWGRANYGNDRRDLIPAAMEVFVSLRDAAVAELMTDDQQQPAH